MATVTVLKFPTAEGAEDTLSIFQDLKRQHLIKLRDAAIVSHRVGAHGSFALPYCTLTSKVRAASGMLSRLK